jgi:hypothetical protein
MAVRFVASGYFYMLFSSHLASGGVAKVGFKVRKYSLIATFVAAVCALPAMAQSQSNNDWDKIVLEQAKGSVMTSTGGDYRSASVGDLLAVGQNMMLAGAQPGAKLVYYKLDDKGRVVRKCVRDYDQANTYVVDASCVGAAAWAHTGGVSGANVGVIVGAALVGAALLGSEKNTPISTGRR